MEVKDESEKVLDPKSRMARTTVKLDGSARHLDAAKPAAAGSAVNYSVN